MDKNIIAEHIKELRMRQHLTQEELGSMVGVSAGAISKWERGVTTPDIMLLAPVARALHTTIDGLLCYSQELNQKELQALKQKLIPIFLKEGFEAGEVTCEALLLEYPSSSSLKLMIAGLYDMYLMTLQQPASAVIQRKQERTLTLLQEVINSNELTLISSAKYMYVNIALKMERYEECEKVLNEMSETSLDPFPMNIMLFMKQNRYEESAQASKGLLLQYLIKVDACLSFLNQIAEAKKDQQMELYCLETSHAMHELFHIGFDNCLLKKSYFYYRQKEDEKAAECFLGYVESVLQAPCDYENHPLFTGLQLEMKPDMQHLIRRNMLEELQKETELTRCKGIFSYDLAIKKIKEYLNNNEKSSER